MNVTDMTAEIRELNLTYLMLAQQMLREDKEAAVYRLSINEDLGDIIKNLTPGQILKMAASNMLLCRLRFNDRLILELLSSHEAQRGMPQSHAAILLSGRPAEVVA